MQQDLVKHGWPSSKLSVVWNEVDPDRYNMTKCKPEDIAAIRERYGVPKDWKMLQFLGRLSWVKGDRNLVLSMPSVLKVTWTVELNVSIALFQCEKALD